MRPTPTSTISQALLTKYGKIIKATPDNKGTMAFCLFPYKKKPKPIALNTTPNNKEVTSMQA